MEAFACFEDVKAANERYEKVSKAFRQANNKTKRVHQHKQAQWESILQEVPEILGMQNMDALNPSGPGFLEWFVSASNAIGSLEWEKKEIDPIDRASK
ncbi:hypothetical protein O9G_005209 [Rozella allomycis CSF55]|uniref:Uncharacterized protein n=1 Tax=Rozella allomycis (strain CSF55) TaxID=988480 RepID=A0A075AWZ2_ROZAC|nr:hypothetical protein O9G_005209 [Rozella allomycis CSF55]|eukprot:EPZ34639.1 hypothetical protein O9G_005209 [Rozella allomycis CSF55]